MRQHRDAAATLATRLAGPARSGERVPCGAVADPPARNGHGLCGDDASADDLGVLSAHQALWPTRHLTGAIRQAEVILSETDGQALHRGQIVRLAGRYLFPPVGVTLYGNLHLRPPVRVSTG